MDLEAERRELDYKLYKDLSDQEKLILYAYEMWKDSSEHEFPTEILEGKHGTPAFWDEELRNTFGYYDDATLY